MLTKSKLIKPYTLLTLLTLLIKHSGKAQMNIQSAKEALKKFFGYDSFRPMQEDIIQSVLNKKDTLVLMPTGGGKSICYQIPAIITDGVTIVISPLIALMRDQVEGLKANGIPAAYINSSLSSLERRDIENRAIEGHIKLLYVSPETIVTQQFSSLMRMLHVSLFAIDEAHCISAWGHDFRPEYTQLAMLKTLYPDTPTIALTATADKITRRDIVQQLSLQEPTQFVSSFDRPNLSLTVEAGQKRIQKIFKFLQARPNQSGIIYCLSRKSTENVAAKLQKEGYSAAFYHGAMSAQERNRVQENFLRDRTPIICATIAFGMGIDKSNVRWVIHYNLPKNIEGYYQEIGRAGRDGVKADTMLFYSYSDVITLRDFVDDSGQKELQLSKLQRMQQYAEAKTCRRKILLSYFGETLADNCGNCDVCHNPPEYFDGTRIAQIVLSAIIRLERMETPAKVGIGMLIDIIRGSTRIDLKQKGYDQIKTYGAGREFSAFDWQLYMQQLIHLGLVEVAYDDGNILRVNHNELTTNVLKGFQNIELTKLSSVRENFKPKAEEKKKTKEETYREELFEILRQIRKEVAEKEQVPPYVVFNDATLIEMSKERPVSIDAMMNISGVGEKKLKSYGNIFMGAIVKYIISKAKNGARIKGSSQLLTYELYQKGHTAEEIAKQRELSPNSIYMHLAMLYEMGYNIDIFKYIDINTIDQVKKAIRATGESVMIKPLQEYLGGDMTYATIGLALAYIRRHEG